MSSRWEDVLARVGAMRPALIESAFRERAIWLNMCRQAGIVPSDANPLWAYINAIYTSDGHLRPGYPVRVDVAQADPELLASIADFAARAIRDGDESGTDRRDWRIEIPMGDGRCLSLTLDAASTIDFERRPSSLAH